MKYIFYSIKTMFLLFLLALYFSQISLWNNLGFSLLSLCLWLAIGVCIEALCLWYYIDFDLSIIAFKDLETYIVSIGTVLCGGLGLLLVFPMVFEYTYEKHISRNDNIQQKVSKNTGL